MIKFEKKGLLRKIAHIINPFNAPVTSDLYTAQPITFESMRLAKAKVANKLSIELISTHYSEDNNMLPEGFISAPFLIQSVQNKATFSKNIKLPLIADILERLYHSTDAEYLIYTNVDIGLYEDFYEKVNQFIDDGHDAFIINRRRISERFNSVTEIKEIYLEQGKKHPGFDCFVFHRSIYPKLRLGGICIGVPFIEITFSQNLFALANNFKLYDNEVLTFHIGMEIYKGRTPKEYFKYNQKEFWKTMNSDLKPYLSINKIPYTKLGFPLRLIKWGLHPCTPTRLILKLEYRNIKRIFTKKR